MIERILDLVLDESKWMSVAMALSFVAIVVLASRQRSPELSQRVRILSALNLFYGCMIGIMASGHLLAVTVKAARGSLEGTLWFLYPLGLVLAIPAWWLVSCAVRLARDEERLGKRAMVLNGCLAVCLLAIGPHNLPLVAPAALNLGYHLHSRRAVGWTVVTITTAGYLALFVGSLIFFASGQSFEQFKGME